MWGLERGYCQMIGGEDAIVKRPRSDLCHARPADRFRPAHAGPRKAEIAGTAEHGYLHCGPNGAGHFVKMVHNGIEYGIMAAYAEGLAILQHANIGKHHGTGRRRNDAAPQSRRLPIRFQPGRRGRSLAARQRDRLVAVGSDGRSRCSRIESSSKFSGRVSDSGEGRWTIKAAIDEAVPAPVLTTALYERFSSRGEADFADRLLSAMRFQFGGHLEKTAVDKKG